jgi:hypothetical protein
MKPFYVYELIDPRDERVFYVGKGQGDRVSQHVKDAKRGDVGGKCDVIRDILAAGLEVTERIVRRYDSEDAAFKFEKRHIAKIGLDNLTNIAPGGREITSEQFYANRDARKLVKSIVRGLRKLEKHQELVLRFAGKAYDLKREDVEKMMHKGIAHVFGVLGQSAALAEFKKHNVVIENNA